MRIIITNLQAGTFNLLQDKLDVKAIIKWLITLMILIIMTISLLLCSKILEAINKFLYHL